MTFTPSPLRDAATIILAKEKDARLEIYLLRRSTKSGFMGGLFVFPGGAVNPQDRDIAFWLPRVNLTRSQIIDRFCDGNLDLDKAVAFSTAAIRETLEEAGVLIASAKDRSREHFKKTAALRLEKNLDENWFGQSINTFSWTLDFSSLGCWSHWITPERMKKRFDTRFFIALMPDNQTCVPDNLETKQGIWLSPAKALEKNLTGEVPLSPPTVVTLTQLLPFADLSELKNEINLRKWGSPIAPVLCPTDAGPVIIEPWDPEFGRHEPTGLNHLEKKVLPSCSSFSRIWCDKGVWKPIDRQR